MVQNTNEIRPLTPRYITVKRACAELHIGKTRIYELLNLGLIVAKKLGRRTLIDRRSLDRLFELLPELQPKAPVKYIMVSELFGDGEPEALPPISLREADLIELAGPPSAAKDGGR